jgi:hypothetical protein
MELESLLRCSNDPTTGRSSKPNQPSQYHSFLALKDSHIYVFVFLAISFICLPNNILHELPLYSIHATEHIYFILLELIQLITTIN